MKEAMLRIVLLLAPLLRSVFGVCEPGTYVGPCLCMQDSNGYTALQCKDVQNTDPQMVFSTIDEYYVSSVDFTDSPSLTVLPAAMFGPVAVGSFRLQNTNVSTVENYVFSSPTIDSLLSIRLSRNSQFTAVNEDLLSGLIAIESAYFSFNGLTGLLGTLVRTGATYFDFSHNQINQISSGFFSQADRGEIFLLGFNNLSATSLTSGSLFFTTTVPNLYLDLGYNRLSSGVSLTVLSGTLPRELILSSNGISILEENVFAPLIDAMYTQYGDSAYILMNGNDIACDCSISWYVVANGRSIIQLATCSDGRTLESLNPSNFVDC